MPRRSEIQTRPLTADAVYESVLVTQLVNRVMLRGQKATLYEGGTRVCAFANWPAKLKPRKHIAPMHAVDWFPTIAAIAIYFNLPLSLGISNLNMTLMYLTFFIGGLTLAIGRTTLLQGVVHLIIFFEYLFLSLVP